MRPFGLIVVQLPFQQIQKKTSPRQQKQLTIVFSRYTSLINLHCNRINAIYVPMISCLLFKDFIFIRDYLNAN